MTVELIKYQTNDSGKTHFWFNVDGRELQRISNGNITIWIPKIENVEEISKACLDHLLQLKILEKL